MTELRTCLVAICMQGVDQVFLTVRDWRPRVAPSGSLADAQRDQILLTLPSSFHRAGATNFLHSWTRRRTRSQGSLSCRFIYKKVDFSDVSGEPLLSTPSHTKKMATATTKPRNFFTMPTTRSTTPGMHQLSISLTEPTIFLRRSSDITAAGRERQVSADTPPAVLRGVLTLKLTNPMKIKDIQVFLEGKSGWPL